MSAGPAASVATGPMTVSAAEVPVVVAVADDAAAPGTGGVDHRLATKADAAAEADQAKVVPENYVKAGASFASRRATLRETAPI